MFEGAHFLSPPVGGLRDPPVPNVFGVSMWSVAVSGRTPHPHLLSYGTLQSTVQNLHHTNCQCTQIVPAARPARPQLPATAGDKISRAHRSSSFPSSCSLCLARSIGLRVQLLPWCNTDLGTCLAKNHGSLLLFAAPPLSSILVLRPPKNVGEIFSSLRGEKKRYRCDSFPRRESDLCLIFAHSCLLQSSSESRVTQPVWRRARTDCCGFC